MGNTSGNTPVGGGVSGKANPWDKPHQLLQDYLGRNPFNVGIMKGFTLEIDTFNKLKAVYDNFNNQGIKVDLLRFYFGWDKTADVYSLSVVPVISGNEDYSYIQSVPIAKPADKKSGPCPPICDSNSHIING
jgi:hypothetical protein